jgi:hypothetical protein
MSSLKKIFFNIYFTQIHTITMQIELQWTALQCITSYTPYTLARFEPTTFCSVGVDDDHYIMPPGNLKRHLNVAYIHMTMKTAKTVLNTYKFFKWRIEALLLRSLIFYVMVWTSKLSERGVPRGRVWQIVFWKGEFANKKTHFGTLRCALPIHSARKSWLLGFKMTTAKVNKNIVIKVLTGAGFVHERFVVEY